MMGSRGYRNEQEKYINQAIEQYKKEKYEETISLCGQALKIQPDYERAYHGIGLALVELERYEEAIPHLDRANRLYHYNKGNFDRQNQIDRDHRLAKVYADWGRALYALKEYDEALSLYGDALEFWPANKAILKQKHITFCALLGKLVPQKLKKLGED